jgi:hypothetical protein
MRASYEVAQLLKNFPAFYTIKRFVTVFTKVIHHSILSNMNLDDTTPSSLPDIHLNVKFEVFTAVTMKNGVFWVLTPCGSCKNRCFGGTWRLLHQGDKNR